MVSKGSENDDEALAKKIYLDHGGSSFFMSRSGIYEEYRALNFDRRKEKEWARERIVELLAMPIDPGMLIGGSFGGLIELIKNSDDREGLEILIEKIEALEDEWDTMSLLLIAESMLRLLHTAKHDRILYDRRLIEREKRIVARLLARASEMKITVAPIYREDRYMKDFLSDQHVLERIENDRREFEGYSDNQ
ncbi:MAG: hypothetical protein JNK74_02115 [Candidatus Hydrogenedentes bacterium]|nr:hypothetical protein [Candidatus Hydrogenedentota bacterium]